MTFDSFKEDTKHKIATTFKIVNITTFAICSLIWKLKLPNLPSEQQYFLQAIIAAALLLLMMFIFKPQDLRFSQCFKVHSFKSYFYRAAINFFGLLAWTKALKLIGMNEAMIITYLTPVLTAFMAVLFFKEHVRASWIVALTFGLIGISVMLYNDNAASTIQNSSADNIQGIALAIFTAVAFSIYNLICKQQGNQNDGYFIQAFYCFALGTVFSLPLVLYMQQPITQYDVTWSAVVGIIGVLSVVTLFLSYKLSSVTKIAPHSYFRIIITAMTMYFVKDEIPSTSLVIAMLFILLGNFCVVFEPTFYKLIYKFSRNTTSSVKCDPESSSTV